MAVIFHFIQEMIPKFYELIKNQYGRKVILYLLSPRSKKYFVPQYIHVLEAGDENQTRQVDIYQTFKDEQKENVTEFKDIY